MHFKRIFIAVSFLFTSFNAFAYSEKISQDVLNAFENLKTVKSMELAPSSLTKSNEKKSLVRVIIKLQNVKKPSLLTSNSLISQFINNNLAQQQKFLDSLKQTGLYQTPYSLGFKPVTTLKLQNAIAGYLPNIEIANKIASLSDVYSIEIDRLNKLFTVEGRILTGSDVVAASGYTGKDIGIAIVDSHFDLLHEELGGSKELPNGIVFAGENFSDPGDPIHSQEMNNCYHGTGTASIARRYAPDSGIYGLTVFPNAYDSVIAEAINWVVENKDGVAGGPPIKIISMSLGGDKFYSSCNSGVIHEASETALQNGIIVIAASGNNGYTNAMASPACSDNVISIGSVWDANNANYQPFSPANCSDNERLVDERTCYSNKSPVLDLYAPSEEVMCARCGGGTWALGGTSSAAPAAAGMTAQLLQAKPELASDKDALVANYHDTGVAVIGDNGKRRINLLAAIGNIETNPPVIESITTQPNEKYEAVTVEAYDSDADLDAVTLFLDGAEYKTIFLETDGPGATVVEQIKYVTLEAGEHCIKAYATDMASNQSEWSDEICFFAPDVPKNPPVIESLSIVPNGLTFSLTGTASDPDDDLARIEIEINESDDWIAIDGTHSFTFNSFEMEEGTYSVKARAVDEGGLLSEEFNADPFELIFNCKQFTNTNAEHEAAGRAITRTSGWWWYGTTTWYTKGSDENLGTSGSTVNTLKEMPKDFFSLGSCPITEPYAPQIADYSYESGNSFLKITGVAEDLNQNISLVTAGIEGVGIFECSGTNNFSCHIEGLEAGTYSVTLIATDDTNLISPPIVFEAVINVISDSKCITDTNFNHVEEGRAYAENVWYVSNAYAVGSEDHLGYTGSVWYSTTTSLQEEAEGYWIQVDSCN